MLTSYVGVALCMICVDDEEVYNYGKCDLCSLDLDYDGLALGFA